jgi:hyperosmotically inducible protein
MKRLVLIAVMLVAGAACTQQAEETTKTRVDTVLDAASSGAEQAAQAARDTAEVITDSWITGKLKVKFADEKLLQGSDIHVETTDRVVTLSGSVRSAEARTRAAAIATGTEGVTSIVTRLVVK